MLLIGTVVRCADWVAVMTGPPEAYFPFSGFFVVFEFVVLVIQTSTLSHGALAQRNNTLLEIANRRSQCSS
jgi:hypothetical protein